MDGLFKRLSISNKLAAVFLFLLFMMGMGGVVGLYNAGQIASVTEKLYLHSFKRVETLSSVENELLSARQEMFLHTIIVDQASKAFLEVSVGEHKKKIDQLLVQYKIMGVAEGNKEHYDGLLANLGGYWHVHSNVMEHSRAGDRGSALSMIRMEGNKSFTDTIDSLRMLIQHERDTAFAAYQRSDYFAKVIIGVTSAFTLLAILVAGGLWLALIRSIVKPIIAIEDSARNIARGDFKHRVPVMTEDEIGNLAVEFNKMAESLHEYYSTLEKKVEERTEELKRANEELSRKGKELELANIELLDANRMKSQFLANVSHELRTPLNSIIGFSELLGERAFGDLNERQSQYVDFVHSSGEHLLRLINNILDLSKIEAGRMDMSYEEFSIMEVLSEVLGIIRPLAHEKNVAIEANTVPASPKLRADKAKFKQIMMNILSNAVKFNRKDGKVDIDWNIVEEPSGMDIERFLVFSVKDTGIGIRDEDKGKLFKEFEQIDSSLTREYEGTGLGLVLTRRLVELHNGAIWFESTSGRGSTFFVKLPQGTEEIDVPETTEYAMAAPASEHRLSVLLASESTDIGHLIEIYLADGPYEVTTALDGLDLLKKVKELKPFAIITGITISKKDGWEVLKELKQDPETTHIPVIIISSVDNKDLGLALGAVEYMEKPIDREKLLRILGRLRGTAKPTRGLSRVLIVDRAIYELKDAVDFLEKDGMLVFKSEPGKRAEDLASCCNPDCIIMRMAGDKEEVLNFVRNVNEHAPTKGIPVIIFTPDGLTDDEKKRLNGMNVKAVSYEGVPLSENIIDVIRSIQVG